MKFSGFENIDFDLFHVDGLEERMSLLANQLRPKFEIFGEELTPQLSEMTGDPMFFHTAKHARRKVNPPNDSWVAFSANARGYKMLPHFQIGLWSTHVFIQWGMIYECTYKKEFSARLVEKVGSIKKHLPAHYVWYKDHMNPQGFIQKELSDSDFEEFARRLKENKNGELMVGLNIEKSDALKMKPEVFYETVLHTWENLLFLHQLGRAE